jgi:hypothetical protein
MNQDLPRIMLIQNQKPKKRNNSEDRDRCEHPKKCPRTRVAKNLENSINNSRELINIAKEKFVIKRAY